MQIQQTNSPNFKALQIKGKISKQTAQKIAEAARESLCSLEKGKSRTGKIFYCINSLSDNVEKTLKRNIEAILKNAQMTKEKNSAMRLLKRLFPKVKVKTTTSQEAIDSVTRFLKEDFMNDASLWQKTIFLKAKLNRFERKSILKYQKTV